MTYPPQPPQDPYGQPYGYSGPQYPQGYGQQGPHQYLPQPYSQPYQLQPHIQPYQQAPQFGPVQWVTVRERGFNPTAFVVHLCLWLLLHWWLAGCTMGIWLIAAIPLTFLGWNVNRSYPVQNIYHPPMYPR